MPFTLSHIAAALPFARTPLIPSALVIGTMVPDLVYFVPLPISRTLTHSLLGVVTVDLVLGLVLFLAWRVALRRPFVDFASFAVRSRLASLQWGSSRGVKRALGRVALLVVVSILIGSITHVAWDAFTHAGVVTQSVPWLRNWVWDHPRYKWLQWASSLFGFLGVAAWIIVWLRRAAVVSPAPTRLSKGLRAAAWASVLAAGLAVSLPVWLGGAANGLSLLDVGLVFRTVTKGTAAAGAVAVLWALAWHLLRVRPDTATDPQARAATIRSIG